MREVLKRNYGGSGDGKHYFNWGECSSLSSSGSRFQVRSKCAMIRLGGTSFEKMGRRLKTPGRASKPPCKSNSEGRKEGLRVGGSVCSPRMLWPGLWSSRAKAPIRLVWGLPGMGLSVPVTFGHGLGAAHGQCGLHTRTIMKFRGQPGSEGQFHPVIAGIWGVYSWLQQGMGETVQALALVLDLDGMLVHGNRREGF